MSAIIYTASCGHSSTYRGMGRIQISDALRCPVCHQIATVVALNTRQRAKPHLRGTADHRGRPEFRQYGTVYCGACKRHHWGDAPNCDDPASIAPKTHLRLHFTVHAGTGEPIRFPWSMEYVRGTSQRARRETYQHNTAVGAILSAGQLWF